MAADNPIKRSGVILPMRIRVKLLMYLAAMVFVVLFGTIGTYLLGKNGGFNIGIYSPLSALYFTIVTLSTVGYGDIYPVTDTARLFVITLIISGLSIFLSAITVISGDFLNSRIERLSGGLSNAERRFFKRHIVLIGYDTTNALLAEKLKDSGKRFIIITVDKSAADRLRERGYHAYVADYTLRLDMLHFGLEKAKEIVVDLRDSSKSVYVVLVVKKIAKNVKLSVVAPTLETETHLSEIGIENIINPTKIAAELLFKSLVMS